MNQHHQHHSSVIQNELNLRFAFELERERETQTQLTRVMDHECLSMSRNTFSIASIISSPSATVPPDSHFNSLIDCIDCPPSQGHWIDQQLPVSCCSGYGCFQDADTRICSLTQRSRQTDVTGSELRALEG